MKAGMELLDLVDSHNRRAMDAQELFGIQLRLEAADSLAQQVRLGTVVNPDVIALGFDTIKVANIQEEDAAGSLHYQAFDVSRTRFQFLEQSHDVLIASIELLFANLNPGSLPGGHKPFAIERLEQIVQRVHFECAHCVLVIGSDENDPWQVLVLKGLEYVEPAELRHLHIQENQIGS